MCAIHRHAGQIVSAVLSISKQYARAYLAIWELHLRADQNALYHQIVQLTERATTLSVSILAQVPAAWAHNAPWSITIPFVVAHRNIPAIPLSSAS